MVNRNILLKNKDQNGNHFTKNVRVINYTLSDCSLKELQDVYTLIVKYSARFPVPIK